MPKGGHGRGATAAIGLLLLFAGLVGGGVLWVLAEREPESAAESFARAVPGCTTTLTFGEPGEFFVFEELSGVVAPVEGCQPSTLPGRPFTFTIVTNTGVEVPRVADDSVSYNLDIGEATSVARITIPEAGTYRISVLGSDPAVVAAVGGDPADGVQQLRRGAIGAIAGGLVLGAFLLWLSARRSKRASSFAAPADPGWGVTERDHARRAEAQSDGWPPAAPNVRQVPVNPMAPDERRTAAPWLAPSDAVVPPTPSAETPSTPVVPPVVPPVEHDLAHADRTDPPANRSTTPSANGGGSTTESPSPESPPAVAWPSDLEPAPERDPERDDADASSDDDDTPA